MVLGARPLMFGEQAIAAIIVANVFISGRVVLFYGLFYRFYYFSQRSAVFHKKLRKNDFKLWACNYSKTCL